FALRNGSRTLQYGSYAPLWTEHEQIFAYERALDGETFTIVCNMSEKETQLPRIPAGQCVFANVECENGETMLPYEARVMRKGNGSSAVLQDA
ncbi:MAG TPA: alpha-glucosidase C-terminal domain-containing protein, partial [Candidatus Cryosericum sp.]|nr:alpha-glucosidase C-terminal domain-containing protein [Candidatus Cryosericum sp.]